MSDIFSESAWDENPVLEHLADPPNGIERRIGYRFAAVAEDGKPEAAVPSIDAVFIDITDNTFRSYRMAFPAQGNVIPKKKEDGTLDEETGSMMELAAKTLSLKKDGYSMVSPKTFRKVALAFCQLA